MMQCISKCFNPVINDDFLNLNNVLLWKADTMKRTDLETAKQHRFCSVENLKK